MFLKTLIFENRCRPFKDFFRRFDWCLFTCNYYAPVYAEVYLNNASKITIHICAWGHFKMAVSEDCGSTCCCSALRKIRAGNLLSNAGAGNSLNTHEERMLFCSDSFLKRLFLNQYDVTMETNVPPWIWWQESIFTGTKRETALAHPCSFWQKGAKSDRRPINSLTRVHTNLRK